MSRRRKACISAFVALWLAAFHYESLRYNYLRPWLGWEPPKIKFLFPPAGWIMFFRVDDSDGRAEVYALTRATPALSGWSETVLDPHEIFPTRWVGYDNIHRNILVTVLNGGSARRFCGYLKRKFPGYDDFIVAQAWTRSLTRAPENVSRRGVYRCSAL